MQRSTLAAISLATLCGLAGCGAPSAPLPAELAPRDAPVAPPSSLPLLLEKPLGGHVWARFCEGRPDEAILPPDPRHRVIPGVDEGRAVVMNAHWRSCGNAVAAPQTCGEWRAQYALGERVALGLGERDSVTAFGGGLDEPRMLLSAGAYNQLWRVWGLTERPEGFDELVAQRYGAPEAPVRNPYPLPGEDPNLSDGGSGQLPMTFTQVRDAEGRWTGQIGMKVCLFCHAGQLGRPEDGPGLGPQVAGAGSIGDFTVAFYDFMKAALLDPSRPLAATEFAPVAGLTVATNRGTGAIDFFQLGFILFSEGDPEQLNNARILFSQSIGTIKSPPWWAMAYRPQKFHGAVLPMDASRIDMAAYYPLIESLFFGYKPLDWVDAHAAPFQLWAEAQSSPPWPWGFCGGEDGSPLPGESPRCINRPLAEQGAILFHALDLWAPARANPEPRPPQGNGSCASCHGVYSPRFAADPRYLASPELIGIAAYALPQALVGTDPVYANAMQSLKERDGTVNDAIKKNAFVYCGLGVAGTEGDTTPVLLAPPLVGTWANAPYFHNGSVPNVLGVLDPTRERPSYWRRVSTPAPEGLRGRVVMGYDTDLERAYDPVNLGWRYEALSCGQIGLLPFLDCDPLDESRPPLVEAAFTPLYTQLALSWNLPRAEMIGMTRPQIEARKIYNTRKYAQGNQGHAFTAVLTEAERRALLEYLKTL